MVRTTLLAALVAALASGCMARVGYTATVTSDGYTPDLVYAAPGVQVLADYDDSIFFVDGFYWRSDGARWWRSSRYNGGWGYATPPRVVLGIERPRAYVHYRPSGWVDRRSRAQPAPVVRDHRGEQPAAYAPDRRRGEPAPIVRDHRDEPVRPAAPPSRDHRDDDRDDHRDHR